MLMAQEEGAQRSGARVREGVCRCVGECEGACVGVWVRVRVRVRVCGCVCICRTWPHDTRSDLAQKLGTEQVAMSSGLPR